MDALALLHRAQEAGLHIEPKGDKLLVRGPKRAEAVVKLLAVAIELMKPTKPLRTARAPTI